MAELFETLMLICFGCSWPMNLAKSIRSKTAKGKSVMFQYAIMIGYVFGICSKFAGGNINYVLALYFGVTSVKKMRHAFIAGLAGYIAGIFASVYICRIM